MILQFISWLLLNIIFIIIALIIRFISKLYYKNDNVVNYIFILNSSLLIALLIYDTID